jgi:hypothetical protein
VDPVGRLDHPSRPVLRPHDDRHGEHRTADGLLAAPGGDDFRLRPGAAALPLRHHGLDHEQRHEQDEDETGDERRLQEHRELARSARDTIDGIHDQDRTPGERPNEGRSVAF